MSKTAIITGASDGLGLETAKILLDHGWRVINISRNKPPVDEIIHIETDLRDGEQIKRAVEKVKSETDQVDALINCAGMIKKHKLESINFDELVEVFEVNVAAAAVLSSGLIELIKKVDGTIVNVGSTVGFKAYPDQAAYGISKWAIRGLTEYLRLELKEARCRVIGFNPGGMNTRFFQKNLNEDFDHSKYLNPADMAGFLVQTIELPNSLEVSDVVVNRNLG